jgi:hypothetical protein
VGENLEQQKARMKWCDWHDSQLALPITHKSLHTTSIILQQQETLTQKLQGCIPSPHYLMSRGRIFFTAEMTANPCDQLHSFTQ